jgi:hypothetical protein
MLSGEAGGDLIFWNGSAGAVTRFGLIVWLDSRAHIDDRAWPLEVGHLAAGAIRPTVANLLVEWSVLFEYKKACPSTSQLQCLRPLILRRSLDGYTTGW